MWETVASGRARFFSAREGARARGGRRGTICSPLKHGTNSIRSNSYTQMHSSTDCYSPCPRPLTLHASTLYTSPHIGETPGRPGRLGRDPACSARVIEPTSRSMSTSSECTHVRSDKPPVQVGGAALQFCQRA